MQSCLYRSPLGLIELQGGGGRLCRAAFRRSGEPCRRSPDALKPFCMALEAYFSNGTMEVDPEWLELAGLTDFRRAVLRKLAHVASGELVTYGELAAMVGRPGAARAVGGAVGCNPLPLFIPCHRVVAAGGRLGGFGGGLDRKSWLLEHEGWRVVEGRIL